MSNLLEKASIVTTPTAYDNGKILSVKPAPSLGVEKIVNGTFDENVNGWITNNANASFVWQINKTALFTSTSFAYVKASPALNLNAAVYKVSFDILSFEGTLSNVHIGLGTSGNTITTTGSYTYFYTSTGGSTEFQIRPNSGGTGSITIDNVSVKEVIDGDFDFTRNSSATRVNSQGLIEDVQILSGNLVSNGDFSQEGSELVTNGDFATDSNWSKSGQVTIGGGVAYFDSDGTFTQIAQTLSGISGKNAKVVIEVTEYNQGTLKVLFSGGAQQNLPTSVGTHTLYFSNVSSNTLNIARVGGVTDIKIDNVSVKEVGQDWILGTGWSIEDGKVYFDNPTGTELYQSLPTTASKYRISFDLDITSGTIQTSFSSPSTSTIESFTTSGTKTVDITTTASFSRFRFVGIGGSVFNIDNVSAVEITDDTNLPRINYEGFSYQDVLGDELVVNGSFNNGTTDWQTEGDSSIVVGDFKGKTDVAKININNTSTNSRIRQGFNYVSGKKYKVTVDIFLVSGSFRMDSRDSFVSGDFVSTTTTGSWITLSAEIYAINTGTDSVWLRSLSQVSEFYVSNVSVKEVLGQEVVPDSGRGSWLFEQQSTNLLPYSEDFSQWSLGANTQLISSNNLAPSGELNAYKFKSINTVGNTYVLRQVGGLINNTTYTFSTWVRADNPSAITVGKLCALNITNGGQYTYIDTSELTTEWKRVSVTATSATSSTAQCFLATDWNVDSEIEFWGAQLEVQSYATSYIPTNGSTVTRLQDAAFGAGSSDLINSTEGVLYAEIASFISTDATEPNRYLTLTNGTSNQRIALLFGGNTNQLRAIAYSNTQSINLSFTTSNTDAKQFNKLAIKYKSGDYAFFLNGIKIGGSTEANIFTADTLNDLSFDVGGGTQKFRGKVKCVAVFKEALTDEELECLTTI